MAQLQAPKLQLAISYSEQLQDPVLWERKSKELLRAASLLRHQLEGHWSEILESKGVILGAPGMGDLQATYFILVGLAIENLCKGQLVGARQKDLQHRLIKKLPDYLSTHDLESLLHQLDFPFDGDQDRELLARLTRCSVWAGRYPAPANSDGMVNVREFESGRLLLAHFTSGDLQRIDHLVDRIQRHSRRRVASGAA